MSSVLLRKINIKDYKEHSIYILTLKYNLFNYFHKLFEILVQ